MAERAQPEPVSGELVEKLSKTKPASNQQAILDAQPHYIAIRTCDRPAYLQRLLLSLSLRQAESAICVLIFDDSRNSSIQQRNQQVVESAQRRFGRNTAFSARYLGQAWQQEFINKLIQQLPADAASIRWLLAPRPAGTFSGGRLLNLMMLVLAGHRFTLFDDDYLLHRARHLGQGYSRELEWLRDTPRVVLAHLSVRDSRAAGQEFGRDPIEAHLEFLGKRLQDCLKPAAGEAAPLLDASGAGTPPEQLRLDQDSVILTTVNGQYGVPIAPNCFHLFYQPSGKNGPAWADPDQYRVLRRGRALWNVTYGPVIAGRTGSTPSGIDNRQMMPPTLPNCKGEDTLFCAMVKYLYPNAAHLDLPWALEHSRKAKSWAYTTFGKPPKIMLARIFWKKADDLTELAGSISSPENRLAFLAQHWLDWSAQPYAELKDYISNAFLRGLRWRTRVVTTCLEQEPNGRTQAHRDLRRLIKLFSSSMDISAGLPGLEDNPEIQGEAQCIEWLAGVGHDYGTALGAWSRLWHAARDMQIKLI